MQHPDRHAFIFQVETQQFAHHVQRRLTSMVAVHPATLTLVPQCNGSGFRRH